MISILFIFCKWNKNLFFALNKKLIKKDFSMCFMFILNNICLFPLQVVGGLDIHKKMVVDV